MADLNSTLVRGSLRVTDDAQVGGSISEGGTLLSNKYLGKTAQAADSAKLGGVAASSYLQKSGGTMTGVLTMLGNQYTDTLSSGALNMNNSDIYGLNSIKFADAMDTAAEGIQFYRDTTHADTLWDNSGVMYYVPNRAFGTSTSAANSYVVLHSGNISSYAATSINSKKGAVTVSGSFSGTAATITPTLSAGTTKYLSASFSGTKTNALVTAVSVNSQGSVTLTANDATATGRITYVQSISGSAPSLGGTKTFVTGYGSFSGGSGSLTSNDTSTDGIAYIATHTNASLGTATTGTVGISGASYTPAGSVTVTSTRTTSGSGATARRVLTITSSFSGTAATITPSLNEFSPSHSQSSIDPANLS